MYFAPSIASSSTPLFGTPAASSCRFMRSRSPAIGDGEREVVEADAEGVEAIASGGLRRVPLDADQAPAALAMKPPGKSIRRLNPSVSR